MDRRSNSVSVAVCVATYRRPAGLTRLLRSLGGLEFNKSKPPDWRIVIVDNDATTLGKELVDGLKEALTTPVLYGVEPERGIALARNRAVQLAGDVDFIAFIDDDEVADCGWLDELLAAQEAFDADVVNGPVQPRFEQPAPSWVVRGRFHDRRRFPTGTEIKWANTGNVLVRARWLHAVAGPFSEELKVSGGEDSLFFSQIYRLGAKIIWADEAIVEEYNPPSRVSANWIITRAHRLGMRASRNAILANSSFVVITFRFLKSALRILLGCLVLAPFSICRGYAGLVRSLAYISLGLGEMRGIIGAAYQDYGLTDGG